VVTPSRRVGMAHPQRDGTVRVQLGSSGPFKVYTPKLLRWATRQEVQQMGLEGVGGLNVVPLFKIVSERKKA